MGSVDAPQKNEVKYLGMHLKAHKNKKKTAQPKSETNALATRKKVKAINRKQTSPIKCSTQTPMDLWISAMGGNL
jgi:hypothetical protein